jgi:hypothetical protein
LNTIVNKECRECPCTKKRRVVIHLENDPGYETERTIYEDPDNEGLLYDNLD